MGQGALDPPTKELIHIAPTTAATACTRTPRPRAKGMTPEMFAELDAGGGARFADETHRHRLAGRSRRALQRVAVRAHVHDARGARRRVDKPRQSPSSDAATWTMIFRIARPFESGPSAVAARGSRLPSSSACMCAHDRARSPAMRLAGLAGSEPTKATIVDADVDMARQSGLESLTIDTVAGRTGLSKSGAFFASVGARTCRLRRRRSMRGASSSRS